MEFVNHLFIHLICFKHKSKFWVLYKYNKLQNFTSNFVTQNMSIMHCNWCFFGAICAIDKNAMNFIYRNSRVTRMMMRYIGHKSNKIEIIVLDMVARSYNHSKVSVKCKFSEVSTFGKLQVHQWRQNLNLIMSWSVWDGRMEKKGQSYKCISF